MTLRTCLAALLVLTASTVFAAPGYDHLFAFGDSYSDNGAGERFTKT
ncbi:MAG: GDSL family lipase, partial [Pseudomonas sp.]